MPSIGEITTALIQFAHENPFMSFNEVCGRLPQFARKRISVRINAAKTADKIPNTFGRADTPIVPEFDTDKVNRNEQAFKELKRRGEFTRENYSETRKVKKLIIPGSKPIGIVSFSDHHIDGQSSDMATMEEDARLVRDTDGLYALHGGDGTDNHIKHLCAIIGSNSTPREQLDAFGYYVGIIGNKWLGLVGGNHNEWTRLVSGIDGLAPQLSSLLRYLYDPDELWLEVRIGDISYRVAIRHKYRFNSSLNQTHTVKRFYDLCDYQWDVGFVCHHHESTFEPFLRHGARRLAFRCSTYQLWSGYSRANGYNDAVPEHPMVILFPDTRKMIPFLNFRDGIDYLKFCRKVR